MAGDPELSYHLRAGVWRVDLNRASPRARPQARSHSTSERTSILRAFIWMHMAPKSTPRTPNFQMSVKNFLLEVLPLPQNSVWQTMEFNIPFSPFISHCLHEHHSHSPGHTGEAAGSPTSPCSSHTPHGVLPLCSSKRTSTLAPNPRSHCAHGL